MNGLQSMLRNICAALCILAMFSAYAMQAVLMFWRNGTTFIPPLFMFPTVAAVGFFAIGGLILCQLASPGEADSVTESDEAEPTPPNEVVERPTEAEIRNVYAPPLTDLRKNRDKRSTIKIPHLGWAIITLAGLCLLMPVYSLLFFYTCPNTEGAMFFGIGMIYSHFVELPLIAILAIVFAWEWRRQVLQE